MNKYKYVEKATLCDFDLCEELFEKLGLKVNDIVPLRKVFILFTDLGKKVLKRCSLSSDKVNFINKAINYINLKDKNIMKYYKNAENEIITTLNNKEYVVLDMIEGREANFNNPIEVMWCSKEIRKFHEASREIEKYLIENDVECQYGINVIDKYIKDLHTIEYIKDLISKYKYRNEFDDIVMSNVDYIRSEISNAIELLLKSNYEKLRNDKNKMVLCHNDLAHHNFIINEENVSLIDFDYCNIDIRIKDIYNFSNKVIKNLAYDKESLDNILQYYYNNNIDSEELQVLYSFINYPEEIVSIIIEYYYKQKAWDEEVFSSRLKNKMDNDKFRVELLNKIL